VNCTPFPISLSFYTFANLSIAVYACTFSSFTYSVYNIIGTLFSIHNHFLEELKFISLCYIL
jgi:hypothetical protein